MNKKAGSLLGSSLKSPGADIPRINECTYKTEIRMKRLKHETDNLWQCPVRGVKGSVPLMQIQSILAG